jgi:hypothetical protein
MLESRTNTLGPNRCTPSRSSPWSESGVVALRHREGEMSEGGPWTLLSKRVVEIKS